MVSLTAIRARWARRRATSGFNRRMDASMGLILSSLPWDKAERMTVTQITERTQLPRTTVAFAVGLALPRNLVYQQSVTQILSDGSHATQSAYWLTDKGCVEAERRCGW
jgi:hypothetical protein